MLIIFYNDNVNWFKPAHIIRCKQPSSIVPLFSCQSCYIISGFAVGSAQYRYGNTLGRNFGIMKALIKDQQETEDYSCSHTCTQYSKVLYSTEHPPDCSNEWILQLKTGLQQVLSLRVKSPAVLLLFIDELEFLVLSMAAQLNCYYLPIQTAAPCGNKVTLFHKLKNVKNSH